MEYRDAMLHYHSDLNVREIDRHFSDIFPYARVDGEILPEITAQEVPEVDVMVRDTLSQATPTVAANEDDPALP